MSAALLSPAEVLVGAFASVSRNQGHFAGSGDPTMSVDTSNATAGVDSARARVAGAIKQAAASSGTSFQYLLTTAKMESDFNPTAGARPLRPMVCFSSSTRPGSPPSRKLAPRSVTAAMPT
jgi:hypothetical protein